MARRIPERIVEGKRLGRHVHHDPRSRDHVSEAATQLTSVRHASVGLPFDQGDIGSCTANALCGALNTAPNQSFRFGRFTERGAVNLYKRETANEGQPYPPNDPGGTGLAVCKAALEFKWITSYKHAFSVQDALLTLVLRPVITGVDWYDSFDTPDKNGLVSITSQASVRGGHEFVRDELIVPVGATIDDLDEILVGGWNNWGTSYGLGGRFYITAATWKTLLEQEGDVTVPIQ